MFLFCAKAGHVYSLDIDLILLFPMDKRVAPNLYWTGAALYTAIEEVNARYTSTDINIVPVELLEIRPYNCTEALSYGAWHLAKYYYTEKHGNCVAVLTAACSTSDEGAALARGQCSINTSGNSPARIMTAVCATGVPYNCSLCQRP